MLVHLQPNVPLLGGSKTLGLDSDRVDRNWKHGNQKVAGIVCLGLARDTGALRRDLHCRSGYNGARFICDRAGKTSRRLTVQEWAEQTYQRTENYREARLLARHYGTPFDGDTAQRKELSLFPRSGGPQTADSAYKLPLKGKSRSFVVEKS